MGKTVTIPRWNQAYGERDYAFTGQVARARPLETVGTFHGLLREMQSVEPRLNSILANWYDAAAGHYIGAHSDDEPALVPGCPIVSVSLCSPRHHRRLWLTPKPAHAAASRTPARWRQEGVAGVMLMQYHGTVVIMGGDTQTTHRHELMKPTGRNGGLEKAGQRVSVTLRAMA
jgi:alkylated DNA repair dioxygenase AlkB